jgi:LPXTG-motif cell wall-anchored protein
VNIPGVEVTVIREGTRSGEIVLLAPIDEAPTILLGSAPAPSPEGSLVQLTATGSDAEGPVTVSWDLDNDGIPDAAGPAVWVEAADGPSSTPITAFVTDSNGRSVTAATAIESLNVAATGTLTLTGPTAGQVTAKVTDLSDPAEADIAGLTVTFDTDGDGTFESNTNPVTFDVSSRTGGSYNVTARITDDDGGSTDLTKSFTVTTPTTTVLATSTTTSTTTTTTTTTVLAPTTTSTATTSTTTVLATTTTSTATTSTATVLATTTTTVPPVQKLLSTVTGPTSPAAPGDVAFVNVSLTNASQSSATNVSVTVRSGSGLSPLIGRQATLDDRSMMELSNGAGWTCTTTNPVVCSLPQLLAGATSDVTLELTVDINAVGTIRADIDIAADNLSATTESVLIAIVAPASTTTPTTSPIRIPMTDLPSTGSQTRLPLVLAVGVFVVGLAMLIVTRRRRLI